MVVLVTVAASMASLKLAAMPAVVLMPRAPLTGLTALTLGGIASAEPPPDANTTSTQ